MPAPNAKAPIVGDPVDRQRKPPTTAHLVEHQWKPGQSGNPHGRGLRKTPLTDALRKQVEREIPDADGQTMAMMIAKRLLQIAIGANAGHALEAMQIIFDRTEGKVLQRNELSTPDGRGLHFDTPASREEAENKLLEILQIARDRRREVTGESEPEATPMPRQIEAVIEQPTIQPKSPAPAVRNQKALDTAW